MDSYKFIDQQEYAYPIAKMCRWINRRLTDDANRALVTKITAAA